MNVKEFASKAAAHSKTVLELVCAVSIIILISQDFYTFLVIKPTLTSVEKHSMKASSSLDIFVCQSPGYDNNALQRNGYTGPIMFSVGRNKSGHFVGWNGLEGENSSQLLEKVFITNHLTVQPSVKLKFQQKKKVIFQKANLTLSKVLFPFGRCFSVNVLRGDEDKKLSGLILSAEGNFSSNSITKYIVLLTDQTNNARIMIPPLQMVGFEIKTDPNEMGYRQYRTRLRNTVNIENDPHLECKVYRNSFTFDHCIQQELQNLIFPFLGCYPSWLTESVTDRCNGIPTLSQSEDDEIQYILLSVMDKNYKSQSCPAPCSKMVYETKYLDFHKRKDRNGLFIQFQDIVETKRSRFVLDGKTFVSRVGGTIGVCKEFLWIIIFTFTSLKFVTKLMMKKYEQKKGDTHTESHSINVCQA